MKTQLTKQEKENWLKKLRSGELEQGNGQLYNDFYNTYCCIGVFGVANNYPLDKEGIQFECDKNVEQKSAKDYYPLLDNKISYEKVCILTKMNDFERKTFPEIANYIEQNIEAI